MATAVTSSFQSMLNEYLPNRMLMEELMKRDWMLSNVEIDNGWTGGRIIVPFKGGQASSVEFGQLADSNDISQSTYVRGTIETYKEAWASLSFLHRDLLDAEGKVPEATFLKILPNELDMLLDYFKEVVSSQLLNGAHFDKFVSDGGATGIIEVGHIDRFTLGQKLEIKDDNSSKLAVYVIAIDIQANTITVSATRGGSAANVSAYTVLQNAKCYHPGVIDNGAFNSLRESLLSAANGGNANIHGVSKLMYPILQAVQINGASVTASNILDKIFDGYTAVRQKGKGNASTVLMSYKHLGSVMKLLESQKGPFVVTKQPSASIYGWTEIEITTVKGTLKLLAIHGMEDDIICFLDMKSMIFRTRGGFKRRQSPDGKEYFEVRGTNGMKYIVDTCLFGELEINKPGHNAVMYGISY